MGKVDELMELVRRHGSERAASKAASVMGNGHESTVWYGKSESTRTELRTSLTACVAEWRLIDDAAKTGEPFMLFSPSDFGNSPGGLIWVSGGFHNGLWRNGHAKREPTHYCCLPPPPTTPTEAEAETK